MPKIRGRGFESRLHHQTTRRRCMKPITKFTTLVAYLTYIRIYGPIAYYGLQRGIWFGTKG